MFSMRFDMRRAPTIGAPATELYQAAIEMATWSETRGCVAAVLCEHHGSPDGYNPSPMVLATAMAARTTSLRIRVAAAILPFYDPIRLAEDMNVLDIISEGRVTYVLAMGYRPEEFEHYGLDRAHRGAIVDEKFAVLREALRGEPFVHEGRRIHVTPPPVSPGGPEIMWGGGTVAAAKRAGRYGVGLSAQGDQPGMREAYETSSREHGHEPGPVSLPATDKATTVFVADDLDRAWEEIGPYLLHDAMMYGAWNPRDTTLSSMSYATTVDALRTEKGAHQILTVDEAVELMRHDRVINLHPLCGGIPPEVAWPYLRRVADEVMPRARDDAAT
jgi:alkanesulfonate monooxygenase SsuD/methylene tetrahydromethanopterin reductase-like flavin-dependent oxidoreductase (luciferase family)